MIEISRADEPNMSKEEARDILQLYVDKGDTISPFYMSKHCKLADAMRVAIIALEEDML